MSEPKTGLIPGTLNAMILAAVDAEPRHGYAISKWIRGRSQEVLRVEEGVLYPALHRLERDRLLKSAWGRNPNGRRVRVYSITPRGRQALDREIARWDLAAGAVHAVLDARGR